jgi:hypothetical protein
VKNSQKIKWFPDEYFCFKKKLMICGQENMKHLGSLPAGEMRE